MFCVRECFVRLYGTIAAQSENVNLYKSDEKVSKKKANCTVCIVVFNVCTGVCVRYRTNKSTIPFSFFSLKRSFN